MARIPDHCETLLLDLDGTLLDLAFDNVFWLETVPAAYAEARAMPFEAARDEVMARIRGTEGTLNWYCIDYWSDAFRLDIRALKHRERERIGFLPGARAFLERARAAGYRLVLATNAHRATLEVKDSVTSVLGLLDAVHSSHDFDAPKEHPAFWQRFVAAEQFSPDRAVLIDDSVPVLRAGMAFGLAGVIAISRPDSRQPARSMGDLPSVAGVRDLAL